MKKHRKPAGSISGLAKFMMALGLAALLSMTISSPAFAVPAELCGPGQHWIETCPPNATSAFPSIATIGIDINLDNITDITVLMWGPTTIFIKGPSDVSLLYPGLRPLDTHLDVIDTEMVSLSLVGGGLTMVAGDGTGNLLSNGPLYSPGAIAELPADPSLASSFFDVFFELQGPFGTLHNLTPLRFESEIGHLPPSSSNLYNSSGPISLVDGSGNERLRLMNLSLTPFAPNPIPEPSTLLLLGSGLVGFAATTIRKLRRKA